MKHAWRTYEDPSKGPGQRLTGEPQRQCAHCLKIQTRHTEHAWMRVTGYRWLPLVGRCDKPLTPHQKIARAAKQGTGVHLTAADVYALKFDDAIMTRARNDDEGTSGDA